MFMFQIGDRYLNLDYLVMAEKLGEGKVRITIDRGVTFDDASPDGERLLAQLAALAADPFPRPVTTVLPRPSAPGGGTFEKGA